MRNKYPKPQQSSSESDADTEDEYVVRVEQRDKVSNVYSPVTDQHQQEGVKGKM